MGSADVRDWQTVGALWRLPASPGIADRGTPSRVDKRVAPDREGAADKQCQGEGKLSSRSQTTKKASGNHLGYFPRQQKTEEREPYHWYYVMSRHAKFGSKYWSSFECFKP